MIGNLIGLIVVGLVLGVLARLVLPGRQPIGILRTILVGVIGAVVAGLVVSLIDRGDVFELNFLGFVIAAVFSVALLAAGVASGVLLESGERRQLGRRH